MKKKHHISSLCCILMFLVLQFPCKAQLRGMRVMEYNVENLFDTLHTVSLSDADFTPQGAYQWDTRRYWSKLSKLSRVIASVGGVQPVDLVALVEVENDSVIHDLTHRTKLWRMGYEAIVSHSQDVRGINVALLYLPHRFRVLNHDSLRVYPVSRKQRVSRDVLHVAGELVTGDTLDVYVCHLPSRRGGSIAQRYRAQVAQRLRAFVDSVASTRQRPYTLLTGDFNGYWPEEFIKESLRAELVPPLLSSCQSNQLYLLTHQMQGRADVRGTYKYQGEWNQLDHFIVNGALLSQSTSQQPCISVRSCKLFDAPFLLKKDPKGDGVRPYRSYLGTYYQGGYSDHLPIFLDIAF